ncbi:FAD-dependent oxidoreductase [Photobacterium sanctipauli]|uniref:FAD-dependent oxidoreductase n=2 Tax=Photobacterium sanctipauli TaxID=1342794 RepID=A0A2T3NZT6_9GAMM|nr:NAD(P)-binding protein [Photobacterium sanctipauli]PSW21796.1 FAD-dependent oxidoreductase [Photobacterium sanctipauli]
MKAHGLNPDSHSQPTVGIIGGGIAGSTIALRLAELGIKVELFEEGTSLVNGPPICHLHAGGNLYREISDEQCITLLKQSIDTLRVFPHTANIRPTVIAIPSHDKGCPDAILPRLNQLQTVYQQLIDDDPANEVLGKPEHYFKLYEREALESLATKANPQSPSSLDDWMIPVAKNLDFDKFKFPLVLVQEYGLSVFRLAATANLALEQLASCRVNTQSKVLDVSFSDDTMWDIEYQAYDNEKSDHVTRRCQVDYLVNACGFQTGTIDDMADLKRSRLVEFKAAYVTHWQECDGIWPEVIFHGERGTPDGMAQLTPYADDYFQLHGMTEDITLFKQGLVGSTSCSAQPKLEQRFIKKIKQGWDQSLISQRSERAISHMSRFLPAYQTATVGGKPLFGAQQIPGDDPTLRAADVSFDGKHYARTEIVKASSALSAADSVLEQLVQHGLVTHSGLPQTLGDSFKVTASLSSKMVESKAISLTQERQYPAALAKVVAYPHL